MLKGTLKYESDDVPIDVWEAMADDDEADAINYRLLLAEARRCRPPTALMRYCKTWPGI